MKQSIRDAGDGGSGRRWNLPTDDEVEAVEVLLSLRKIHAKSEFLSRYTFTWGRKKKRSALVPKPESSPEVHRKIDDKSPSTPLRFLPGAGGDKPKRASYLNTHVKKKTLDLLKKLNQMAQEREILVREIKAKENLHEKLRAQNLELKARKQEINSLQFWNNNNNSTKMNLDQQITMFAMACTSNNNSHGRFGFFNQVDPRVTTLGEPFDFTAPSRPLDQNNYMMMDNDLRVRIAAAARRRRIVRMKENKNSLKLSRGGR